MDQSQLTQTQIKEFNDWAGFLSFKPNFIIKALGKCTSDIIFIETGNQAGKCLKSLEFLYTPSGIIRCDEFRKGELVNGTGYSIEKDFEDDLYEVTFQNGIKITCNREHPFFFKHSKNINDAKGRFIPLKDLKEKEYVYFCPASSFNFEENSIKNSKLFGYLCSDGYLGKYGQSIKFTNTNIVFLKEVSDLSMKGFGIKGKWTKKGNGFDLHLTEGSYGNRINPVKKCIDNLCINNDSFGKITSGDKESLVEFVKGFFNGDGYLLIRKRVSGFGKLPSIEVGFSIGGSRRKAYEFQYMLWKLGIFSYVISETMNKGKQLFYRVKVNTWCALDMINILDWTKYPDKFKEAIGYLNKNIYKRKNNRNWISIKKIKHVGKGFVCPISTESGELISYCGMRTHNTDTVMFDYVRRIMGKHPIESKNMRPNTPIRTIRLASETLPVSKDGATETRNTIFPALMKRLPSSWIKKKITFREPSIIINDPQKGPPIVFEFVSYGQEVQSQAGVQRWSIYLDEEPSESFFEEQVPRLMAANADLIIGCTPAEHLTWLYEKIYNRRRITYNSPTIIKYMKDKYGEKINPVELADSSADIAVIRAASDDNPTMTLEYIEDKIALLDDPDVKEIRRYGIFHQISGRIFKDFDINIHRISRDKYFPDGIPYGWFNSRGIDFHEQTPWAVGWVALSQYNEAFLWQEFEPSPDKVVTLEIATEIAKRSGDYRFKLNLIDPLAEKNQVNTGLTSRNDLNRIFNELKREGIGTGGYWETWDTKSLRGRDAIKERLKNSRLCGRPFNNRIVKNGIDTYIPTLWVLDNCPRTVSNMKSWAWDEWATRDALVTKDEKNKPQQKNSHFPMVLEGLFKHPGFNIGRYRDSVLPNREPAYRGAFSGRM